MDVLSLSLLIFVFLLRLTAAAVCEDPYPLGGAERAQQATFGDLSVLHVSPPPPAATFVEPLSTAATAASAVVDKAHRLLRSTTDSEPPLEEPLLLDRSAMSTYSEIWQELYAGCGTLWAAQVIRSHSLSMDASALRGAPSCM